MLASSEHWTHLGVPSMQAAALEEEPSVMPETEHPRVVAGAQGKLGEAGLTPCWPLPALPHARSSPQGLCGSAQAHQVCVSPPPRCCPFAGSGSGCSGGRAA